MEVVWKEQGTCSRCQHVGQSLQINICTELLEQTFLPPATKLGHGNIFRSVCQQFCPHGGVCMVLFGGGMYGFIWGGVHGFIQGACVVLFGGVRGFIWGACMVLFGGACMVFIRGACMVLFGGRHAWFYSGGMHGFIGGACVVFSVFLDTMRYGQ